jgi:hypothetical protein
MITITRALILLIVSLSARTVCADAPSLPSKVSLETDSEARQHFDRGVELYRESSFDAALVEFERTYQLTGSYKLLYNLAQVQAERHAYVEAYKLLTEYLSKGGTDVPNERRQAVLQDLAKFKQRTATLTIAVNVDGAEVFVNDVSRGISPLSASILVDVGKCQVRAEKAGYERAVQQVAAAGSERHHVSLTLAKAAAAAATAPVTPAQSEPQTTANLTPFWIALGATAVLGATTATFAGLAVGADHDLNDVVARVPSQAGELDSARSKLRTFAALTDGFGAATLVAAGFAVYFILDAPSTKERRPADVRAQVKATPTGVSLTGTF